MVNPKVKRLNNIRYSASCGTNLGPLSKNIRAYPIYSQPGDLTSGFWGSTKMVSKQIPSFQFLKIFLGKWKKKEKGKCSLQEKHLLLVGRYKGDNTFEMPLNEIIQLTIFYETSALLSQ